MNRKHFALISSVVLALVALAPVSSASAAAPSRSVTVNGTGSVQLTNDRATVDVSVSNIADSTAQATQQTAADLAALKAALMAAGVAKTSLSTTNVYVAPEYNYDGNVRTLIGYRSSVSMSVKATAASAGAVVEAAVSINDHISVNGVMFSSSKSATAMAKAREAAIRDARTAAASYAKAAGARLGVVTKITDSGSSNVYPYPQYGAKADAIGVPLVLDAGRSTLTASVTVEFSLR